MNQIRAYKIPVSVFPRQRLLCVCGCVWAMNLTINKQNKQEAVSFFWTNTEIDEKNWRELWSSENSSNMYMTNIQRFIFSVFNHWFKSLMPWTLLNLQDYNPAVPDCNPLRSKCLCSVHILFIFLFLLAI